MRIPDVHRALVRRSQSPVTRDLFAEARTRHAALGAFDTPCAMVAYLRRNEGRCAEMRSAIVAALIAEVQSGPTADWLALLVLALFPGLLRLRERLAPRAFEAPDDLTALTFECFCEAAVALPLSTQGRCAVLNLMSATRRQVFRHVNAARALTTLERSLDERHLVRIPANELDAEQAIISIEAAVAHTAETALALLAEPGVCRCELDVTLAVDTIASNLPLSEWVRRTHPGLSEAELARTYERVRRRRSRIVARARGVSQRATGLPLSPANTTAPEAPSAP
jgi:hypothetical protein